MTALTAGAFEFFAGSGAEIGAGLNVANAGAGARSSAKLETLNRDGDKAACGAATDEDKRPPQGCGALLRIEVVPLDGLKPPEPTCPAGSSWNGTACMAAVDPSCPGGMHFAAGRGCVADVVAQVAPQPAHQVAFEPAPSEPQADRSALQGSLGGLRVRVVHIARRARDARAAAERLRALGATVDLFETSDGGNDAYMGQLWVKAGYQRYAAQICDAVRTIEPLAPQVAKEGDTSFAAAQHFNLWVAR